MKKVIFGFVVLSLLFISSCSKTTSNNNPDQSWTLKGTTYQESTGAGGSGVLTIYASNTSTLFVNFYQGVYPTASTTMQVVATPTASNQISIGVLINSTHVNYLTTGTGANQTANVSVGTDGKLTVSGTNLTVHNTGSNDTTTLNLNVLEY